MIVNAFSVVEEMLCKSSPPEAHLFWKVELICCVITLQDFTRSMRQSKIVNEVLFHLILKFSPTLSKSGLVCWCRALVFIICKKRAPGIIPTAVFLKQGIKPELLKFTEQHVDAIGFVDVSTRIMEVLFARHQRSDVMKSIRRRTLHHLEVQYRRVIKFKMNDFAQGLGCLGKRAVEMWS